MKSNEVAYPKWASWAVLAALATTGAAGLGLWMTQDASLPLRSVGSLVALTTALSMVWLYRVRAARRLFATLNAYAERELARTQDRRLASPNRNKHALSRSSV